MVSQRILQKPNTRAGQQACDRAAAGHGEKDHDQQRQVENREERKSQRDKRLEENGEQGNQHRYRQTEPVDLDLLAGCVSHGHAY